MQQALSYRSLPTDPGVYVFKDKTASVLYVGKGLNLKKRVSSYFRGFFLGIKTHAMVSQIDTIFYTVVDSELEALLLEANYIKKYSPRYNTRLTDGKAYPLIQITLGDCPKVLIARRENDPKSIYFGPYPSSKSVKLVLKMLRKIFPYQSVLNHPKRLCLYNHLQLCPCPPLLTTGEQKKHYKKTIRHITKFLQGKSKLVVKELEKERDTYTQEEYFEKAKEIQDQLQAIHYITQKRSNPLAYELNPNLTSDLREKELNDLKLHLKGGKLNMLQKLTRIECFDISNISGKYSVGSMVVFTNGEKDSSEYRRFKIRKTTGIPNDFAAMQEVLSRRLKHPEWQIPDLIIVDGGKGQISSAQKALNEVGIGIPLIGLTKREEIIITNDFKEIKLSKDSAALHLVQRIRDEAHRFAITYHRKLRSKFTFV